MATALASAQRRYYSLEDMPETNFDCRDKILGGYYADPEANCQMFHVCVKIPGQGVSYVWSASDRFTADELYT